MSDKKGYFAEMKASTTEDRKIKAAGRKEKKFKRTLENKFAEYEEVIEDLQAKMDELRFGVLKAESQDEVPGVVSKIMALKAEISVTKDLQKDVADEYLEATGEELK